MNRLGAQLVRPVGEHLLGIALVALAATPWLAVTGTRTGLVHLGVATVGATVLSLVLVRLLAANGAVELLSSTAGLAVVLLVVVVGDVTAADEVLRGLRDGVPRILSTSLPLLDVAWAGVPGTVVVWGAAALVASIVARTSSVAWPVLLGLATFVSGYALTLGGRGGEVAQVGVREALLLALTAGALAVLRRTRRLPDEETAVRLIRLAGAAMTVVVAVALGAVAADRGPFVADEPVQPRLSPPAVELDPEGPLLVTRRLRGEEPDRTVATVTVDRDWSGYLPVAVLDRYDGRSWSRSDDRLLPTGGVVPATLPPTDGPVLHVDGLDVAATGGWLPFVGRPAEVAGASVVQDAGEVFRLAEPAVTVDYRVRAGQPSTSVVDDDLDGDAPTARSSGLVRPLEVARLAADQRAAGERVCRLLALTAGGEQPVAGELSVRGAPCARRGPDQVDFVRALADELARGRAVEISGDDGASAGGPESLADLLELVGPPSSDGRSTGAPEQFAAAYTLIADGYGLPVRLVTGFRVEEPRVGRPIELRGADAWTWAEVAVEDVGWVVVDPTPSTEDAADDEQLEQPEELGQGPTPPQQAPAELGVEAETVVVGPPPVEERTSPLRWVAIVAGVIAALLLVPLLIAAGRRRYRWWHRRRGDARARTVGAWHELLELAHRADVDEVEARSTQGVVAGLTASLAAGTPGRTAAIEDELAGLPAVVDRALYSSRDVEDAEADRAWATVGVAHRRLRGTRPVRRRLVDAWRVAPRSITAGPRPRRERGRRRDDATSDGARTQVRLPR